MARYKGIQEFTKGKNLSLIISVSVNEIFKLYFNLINVRRGRGLWDR